MPSTSDQPETPRESDVLARAIRISLAIYLSPVILAVFAVGFVAMAVIHLVTLTAIMLPHAHRSPTHRGPVAAVSRLSGHRIGRTPLA